MIFGGIFLGVHMFISKFSLFLALGLCVASSAVLAMPVLDSVEFPKQEPSEQMVAKQDQVMTDKQPLIDVSK